MDTFWGVHIRSIGMSKLGTFSISFSDFEKTFISTYNLRWVPDEIFDNFPENTSLMRNFSEIFMEIVVLARPEISFEVKVSKLGTLL